MIMLVSDVMSNWLVYKLRGFFLWSCNTWVGVVGSVQWRLIQHVCEGRIIVNNVEDHLANIKV